jgi:hypothetical protein
VSDNDDAGRTWAQNLQTGLTDAGATASTSAVPLPATDLNDWFVRTASGMPTKLAGGAHDTEQSEQTRGQVACVVGWAAIHNGPRGVHIGLQRAAPSLGSSVR